MHRQDGNCGGLEGELSAWCHRGIVTTGQVGKVIHFDLFGDVLEFLATLGTESQRRLVKRAVYGTRDTETAWSSD